MEGLYFAKEWGQPYFYGGMQAWMSTHPTDFWQGYLYRDMIGQPPPTQSIVSGMGYIFPYIEEPTTFYCPGTTASFSDNFGGEPWWGEGSWYSTWTGDHHSGYYKFGEQGKGTLTTYFYRGGMYEKNVDLPETDPAWQLHQNWTNLELSRPTSTWIAGKPMLTCYWPGYNGETLTDPMLDTVNHEGEEVNLLYHDGSSRTWNLPSDVTPLWNWYNALQYSPTYNLGGFGNYNPGHFYTHAPWWWVRAYKDNQ
jgi:hypothetical protein